VRGKAVFPSKTFVYGKIYEDGRRLNLLSESALCVGDTHVGLPPALEKRGCKLVDPGRYQNLSDDFSAQIAAFKKANCEIITGVVIPPDLRPSGINRCGRALSRRSPR
jgi:hypothetical protein